MATRSQSEDIMREGKRLIHRILRPWKACFEEDLDFTIDQYGLKSRCQQFMNEGYFSNIPEV